VAVLLYHGQVAWMRGGFLGVDLFFVLSGYLITSLLLLEWARTGTIDLARFWSRRARRLLPALFLVLLTVCAYATWLARPSQRESLRWDVLSTLAYLPNWRSALGEQSYFAQYSDPSPLRHMWSLGIEEQFYLLFPVLLLVWLGLSSGRARGLRIALLAGAAGSALLMLRLYDPSADPSRAYYGTDTRAQALLVGALLAAWAAGRATSRREPVYLRAGPLELPVPGAGALGLLGLAGFLALAVAARDLAPWVYRGGFLLVAVCCAGLIAGATRAGPGSLVVRALSWAPLRAIGVVSYGLYLWHWPVYVVVNPDRTGLTGLALLALRLATTALLAALSFRLVEQPVRRGRWPAVGSPVRPRMVAVGAAVVVAVAAVAATSSTPIAATAKPDAPAPAGAVRTFIIGDSVAWVLWSKVRQRTIPDLEVRGSTQLGCGLIAIPVVVDGQVEPLGPTCDQFDSRWPGEAAGYQPDVAVLMLGVGEQFDRQLDGRTVRFGTPAYTRFLYHELDERVALLGGGVRPVVLVTVPCHQALETGVSRDAVIINDEQRVRWLNSVQRRYAGSHADQVHLVDLHGFLCPNGYTDAVGGVDPLRTDGVHFTPAGVQLIWRWLGPQLVDIARGIQPQPSAPA
jgi:peptidoglycan/LPS O-acetylase OafA/YrhL